MATSKRLTSIRVKRKQSFVLGLMVAGVILPGVALLFRQDPTLSKEEIDRRLQQVVNVCTDNETSEHCRSLKEEYDMSFQYCNRLSDMYKENPDTGETVYQWVPVLRQDMQIKPPLPVYGVARQNDHRSDQEKIKQREEMTNSQRLQESLGDMEYTMCKDSVSK